ncbi:hypothetical protein [Rosistilla oblonga]|uniref:RIFT barrel domain-containing protein n=1 Tax=Rosistilla oblonga TaxID=2527990 RepID=UPI003A9704D0
MTDIGGLRWRLEPPASIGESTTSPVPVRVGVPCPAGLLSSPTGIRVRDDRGQYVLVQHDVVARWPDDSVRWCLLDLVWEPARAYFVSLDPASADDTSDAAAATPCVSVTEQASRVPQSLIIQSVGADGQSALTIHLQHGGISYYGALKSPVEICDGPVRWSRTWQVNFVSASNEASPLVGELTANSFACVPGVRFTFSIRNPKAMDHPGGNWDLGAKGAVQIDKLSVQFSTGPDDDRQFTATLGDSATPIHASRQLHIYQDSSGGENWDSTNHLAAGGRSSVSFPGYLATADETPQRGRRAQPILRSSDARGEMAIGYHNFWQSFPKAVTADRDGLTIELFPAQTSVGHELQGGEQKTHEFAFEIRSHDQPSCIVGISRSPVVKLTPAAYATAAAIPYLPLANDDQKDCRYESLVAQAIEGDDTFDLKSETIDEFGWRHFGDLYGDHEAVYHGGDAPMISHYNNQYDCTLGFAIQFMRSGDRRWFDLMTKMADHAWDIDTYHTDEDKLLYNHGLFWHTYHYADAHTATHRSYPKQLRISQSFDGGQDLAELGDTGDELTKNYAVGGGPAASHNYSTGWMLAYYLTGEQRYRTAAISAADYVLAIDDGRKTPFRWLSLADTGHSTCSSEGYYGPGRAAANSTHALLTGHELTGDKKYLQRASLLMRRTVHPRQDLAALDLLNAELRWFYTMYLQALGRFVDYKQMLGELDDDYCYGVATLLHYADWMVKHERPTLSEPDKLQYPNETWAAQDMRKWHVLQHATLYQSDRERRKAYQTKADYFFDDVCATLTESPTKSLCRPVVLMLNFGWQRGWFKSNPDALRLQAPVSGDFGWHAEFVPQRTIAVRRFKRLVFAGGGAIAALATAMIVYWLAWAAP